MRLCKKNRKQQKPKIPVGNLELERVMPVPEVVELEVLKEARGGVGARSIN